MFISRVAICFIVTSFKPLDSCVFSILQFQLTINSEEIRISRNNGLNLCVRAVPCVTTAKHRQPTASPVRGLTSK